MKKIYKLEIDGCLFLRVININENNELLNIYVYKKENGLYKQVYPTDLGIDIQNKLNVSEDYEPILDEKFINEFTDCVKNIVKKVKTVTQFKNVDYVDIDIVYDTIYSFIKPKNTKNIYELNGLVIDENSNITAYKNIPSVELPYILVNILNKYDKKNIIIHIFKDLYVKVEKHNNIIYVIAYEFQNNSDGTFLNINNIYAIVTNDREIKIINDLNDSILYKFKDKTYLDMVSKEFLDEFDLAILEK